MGYQRRVHGDFFSLEIFNKNIQRPFQFTSCNMTSSKGKPTDPELREQIKEEIKAEPNKSGGGEGQWSAWKVRFSLSL